jgi:Ca2+-binding EF-hand superfamily protein
LVEFEEAFNLFAKDGIINSRDLRSIMKVLEGSPPTDDQLKKMIQLVDCDGLFIYFVFFVL